MSSDMYMHATAVQLIDHYPKDFVLELGSVLVMLVPINKIKYV